MVWSRITVVVFVAFSLIMLGVGMTTLRYQNVNARHYAGQQNEQKRHFRNETGSTGSPTSNTSSAFDNPSANFSLPSTTSSWTSSWPPSATEIVQLYVTAPSSVTFGQLASAMLPLWYDTTIDAMRQLNKTLSLLQKSRDDPSTNETFVWNATTIPSKDTTHTASATNTTTKTTVVSKSSAVWSSAPVFQDQGLEWELYRTQTLLWYTLELLEVFRPLYDCRGGLCGGDDCNDGGDELYSLACNSSNPKKTQMQTDGNSVGNQSDACFKQKYLWAFVHSYVDQSLSLIKNVSNQAAAVENDQLLEESDNHNHYTALLRSWMTNSSLLRPSDHSKVVAYLTRTPTLGCNSSTGQEYNATTKSTLYWSGDTAEQQPDLHTLAYVALAQLGKSQLIQVRLDLDRIMIQQSKDAWDPQKAVTAQVYQLYQTIFRLRTVLRAVVDQQVLFQDFFIPFQEHPDKCMVLFKEARALLGLMEDDSRQLLNEYNFTDTTPSKINQPGRSIRSSQRNKSKRSESKKLKQSLKVQWKGFQWWVKAVDLDSAIKQLIDGMEQRILKGSTLQPWW